MAKQRGSLLIVGKFKDAVGYKNNLSKVSGAYAVRGLAGEVKNPKTVAQSNQRMKVPAAQNFYRALSVILDHSWQGVKYGARSYSEFLSRAMLMTDGFPFVEKGSKTPWPGAYAIAGGGLAPMPVYFDDNVAYLSPQYVNVEDSRTIGEFSTDLLAAHPNLAEGDQLTFVFCMLVSNYPVYHYGRLVIDTQSTETIAQWEASQGLDLSSDDSEPGTTIVPNLAVGGEVVAFGCIVSRPPRNAGGTWQRSNAIMLLTDAYRAQYLSAGRYTGALATYREKEAAVASSDWYLNQGNAGNAAGGTGGNGGTSRSLVAAAYSGVNNAMFLVEGSTTRLVVASNTVGAAFYSYDSTNNTYASAGTLTGALEDNEFVLLSAVLNYFPELESTDVPETNP